MNKIKPVIFSLFLFYVSMNLFSQKIILPGDLVESEYYERIIGVWDFFTNSTMVTDIELSWGEARYVPNGSLIIDFRNDKLFFDTGGMGTLSVVDLEIIEDDIIKINILDPHQRKGNIVLNYKDNGFWIQDNTAIGYITWSGDNYLYLKRSGPNFSDFGK